MTKTRKAHAIRRGFNSGAAPVTGHSRRAARGGRAFEAVVHGGRIKPGGARRSRVALAMAGGGPLGAIYEVGALTALAESLQGIDLNDLDIYVGVSAGGIIGAGLANRITPREMSRMFIEPEPGRRKSEASVERFDPTLLMRPAFAEYVASVRKLPPLLIQALWRYAFAGRGLGVSGFVGAAGHLAKALPTGFFSSRALQEFLARIFGAPGRTDDFRALRSRLFLVATDLDSGVAVEFGAPEHDAVPISLAAVASSALPGLFPPVTIAGRQYVDGALNRTLHASVALKQGADLVLCLNPLVPYDDRAVADAGGVPRRLIDGGLPNVLMQTMRSVIRSRMEIGMRQYGDDYPDADVILFEPDRADGAMFFANMFSYANRNRLGEHAYQRTRAQLWTRRHQLTPLLARHGISLNLALLRDRSRTLIGQDTRPARRPLLPVTEVTARLTEELDDLGRYLQQARRAPMVRVAARR